MLPYIISLFLQFLLLTISCDNNFYLLSLFYFMLFGYIFSLFLIVTFWYYLYSYPCNFILNRYTQKEIMAEETNFRESIILDMPRHAEPHGHICVKNVLVCVNILTKLT